ncbi:hypothetical protein [Lentzea sp. NPDC060358]|uniref:RipA family octameric membrane protein n=1 Tax=Lentzea sp. NPDC060358 TaxID=3347103 RepID=UPI00366997C2
MRVHPRVRAYFVRDQASHEDVSSHLWNGGIDPIAYVDAGEKYRAAIMEQYKLYVEMADRISARRALANTFFLTLNTAVIASYVALAGRGDAVQQPLPLMTLLLACVQCVVWYWTLRSYRQLSSAKFRVVGALEEQLPASPYWRAEWTALGQGRDKSLYWPLSRLEQWVPPVFALFYLSTLLLLIL